jgi:hypothetical protein
MGTAREDGDGKEIDAVRSCGSRAMASSDRAISLRLDAASPAVGPILSGTLLQPINGKNISKHADIRFARWRKCSTA